MMSNDDPQAVRDWVRVETIDEMEAFYFSRLPAIRSAAREHGYAIGVHGSARRDFDLIAVPWRDGASDKDTLAHAIAKAACGLTRAGAYDWEQKPAGRYAVSMPVCWTAWHDMISAGHIDLSVMPPVAAAHARGIAKGRRLQAEEDARIAEEGSFPFDIEIWLQATKKEMTERTAKAIAAAIRSEAAKIGDSNA